MSGFVIWMTGLSGSGKSTLASLLTTELTARGVHVESLDGDEVRKNLSHGLGFEREDRDRNVRRIGYVARMVARSGSCAITAAISPYRAMRDEVRSKTENFIEVYCECPLDVLTARDPKGLYKQALAGEIKHFTGVDDPYEAPLNPEVHLRTDRSTPEECIAQIVAALDARGLFGDTSRSASLLPPAFGGEVFEARTLGSGEGDRAQRRVEISQQLADLVEFVAHGFMSPLAGFMTMREAHKVRKQGALERGTPWWSDPFVLPLPAGDTWNEGEALLLSCQTEVVARTTLQEIWQDGELQFGAGSIDAVRPSDAQTARGIRQWLVTRKNATASCLYLVQAPTQETLSKVAFAEEISAPLVLGIAESVASQWSQRLGERSIGLPRFVVPVSVPVTDERAQAVLSRSVGATNSITI